MTRKRKDYRELKVSSFSGYGYKSAPMLRIQGLWLEELGFNIGDPILVKCEDGKLIITVDHAREDAETKEQAFLDEEMKKLQKKFEVEKKKIYQQVVAEISPSNTDNSLILLMLSFSFHILIFKVRCQSLCHHTYCDEDVT